MKTFKDLQFSEHHSSATSARMNFDNNYGVSVLLGSNFYSNGVDTYEVGILYGDELTYSTSITDDVLPHQTKDEVSEVMKEVQKLTQA